MNKEDLTDEMGEEEVDTRDTEEELLDCGDDFYFYDDFEGCQFGEVVEILQSQDELIYVPQPQWGEVDDNSLVGDAYADIFDEQGC